MTEFNFNDVIELLKNKANRPLSLKEIQSSFNLNAGERKQIARLLKGLVREGSLVQLKGGRFALPHKVNLVVGTLFLHRDGYGFVAQGENSEDVFVPARYVRPAMHGDRVVVRVERGQRNRRPEGRVIRVEQRAHDCVVGRYEPAQGVGYVVPADPKVHEDLLIPAGSESHALPGQVVVARITQYPDRARSAVGRIVEVLGEPDDPDVEIKVTALRFKLPYEFSASCLAEAKQLPLQLSDKDLVGRNDLRQRPFVTIDGETARDYDDAVAIERSSGGTYRLWVAIADVAHYVCTGSAIDQDARSRGTSVYFPGACLPMLPEVLSNDLCSLKPDVDRLAMVAELDFDSEGRREKSSFYPAVIRSVARLTYTEVASVLIDRDVEMIKHLHDRVGDLEVMAELANLRMQRRRERGSLDLDVPETDIRLDLRGKPESIVRAERNLAHKLIEEFMLAANEAVAQWLEKVKAPLIYRVHEQPSEGKMHDFQEFIAHFNQGLSIPEEGVNPGLLQDLLERVAGRPEERVVNHVLLRSLPQAYYTTVNRGHFGLASSCYCHFTSPIRRYPDLMVHRVLKQKLAKGTHKNAITDHALEDLASLCTVYERRAMEAERDIVNLKKCQFMVDKVGETYEGLITSVQAFGFFVELQDYFVEGLVHVSSLEDDFYHYDEDRHQLVGMNRRRTFEIGTAVKVTVYKVNLERREIDFQLVNGYLTKQQKVSRHHRGLR